MERVGAGEGRIECSICNSKHNDTPYLGFWIRGYKGGNVNTDVKWFCDPCIAKALINASKDKE